MADSQLLHGTSSARTVDCASYCIRPIRLDDAGRERDFICGLSEASRYNRLLHVVREPSAVFIYQMVNIDFRHAMAFAAVVGEGRSESFIGVARYAGSADNSEFEFAIVVADLWQSRGVGTAIAHRLIDHARAQGVRTLHAGILATNTRMITFAHRLGFTTRFTPGEATMVTAELLLTAIHNEGLPAIASERAT